MCFAGFSLPMARQGMGHARLFTRKEHLAQVLFILMSCKLLMWNWQAAAVVLQMGDTQIITIAEHRITTTFCLRGGTTVSLRRSSTACLAWLSRPRETSRNCCSSLLPEPSCRAATQPLTTWSPESGSALVALVSPIDAISNECPLNKCFVGADL